MMDFLKLAHERYSVRKFDGRPLTGEDTEKIIQAGILAPTAKNFQPERIFILKSEAALAYLKACTQCDYGTKTAFLICYDQNSSWKREFDEADSGYVDASIVATHMMMEAASIGVGTTWVMWFDAQKARTEFSLPDHLIPVCFLVAGYPATDAVPSHNHENRKTTEEIVKEI